MKTSFHLTEKDLAHQNSPGSRWKMIVALILLGIVAAPFIRAILSDPRPISEIVQSLSGHAKGTAIYVIGLPFCIWLVLKFQLKAQTQKLTSEKTTFTVTEAALVIENGSGTHTLLWKIFRRITSDNHGIFFVLSPYERWIVPSHAFTTVDEQNDFLKLAQQYFASAQKVEPV